MTNEKWFTKAYRRNLVDMHIEDWSEEFLSAFEPADYAANLKKAHIQAPMLYLQFPCGVLQPHLQHCGRRQASGVADLYR